MAGVTRAYDSYEALCADPEVDVVYVGTLHPWHFEHTTLALNSGKHVLVEKPMAMNVTQASAAIALAKEKKLFLMEGMWTRFFPGIRFVRKLLADKELGDVHHMHASFGVEFDKDNARMWKNELGGGGLLDLGIYPLAFASMVFGPKPEKVTSAGKLNDGGVDIYNSVTLEYSGQRFATVEYSMLASMAEVVTIAGSKGRIHIDAPAHTPVEISVIKYLADGKEEEKKSVFPWPTPAVGATFNYGGSEGFIYEAEAVTKAIQSNQLESDEYSLDESLGIMTIMDSIRKQLGLVYPADAKHACILVLTYVCVGWAIAAGFARAYGSYEALCADPEVDVVYVGTIHLVHFEHITLALSHGKHVLAEKPLTMNAKQTASVIALAKAKSLFLMEGAQPQHYVHVDHQSTGCEADAGLILCILGVWTRFFPSIKYVRQLLADKRIGDVQHVHGHFGGAYLTPETETKFRSSSGDGGLIGIGIYPLSFVTMVFGSKPEKITAMGKLSAGGADVYGSATLEFSDQRFGTINYTCLAEMGNVVTISGSKGRIHLPSPAHTAVEVAVTEFLDDGTQEKKTTAFPWPSPSPNAATAFNYPGSEAFIYEAEAVTKAIRSGQVECEEYSLEESLAIAEIMDEIRQAVGVTYEADKGL
ncbi:hypothetical protein BBJ28_00019835 [Nothophytophthora sp. Chile5]|nr:hypothetical protein BBJ28_00019835 [Nothophytophthora sp. Chile5]